MPWPGITDFSEAVQNPRLCFKGTDLEGGKVSLNQRGMPLVFSGAFACVYRVSVGNQTFAVRCFTREVSDQRARYGELSNYLLNVLPPSFVHFEYVEHGISLRGDRYPIVKMEWVDGDLLSRFVGSRLDQSDTLRRVAAQWRGGPTASLRGLRIAHNDLQHGNVMVQRDGSIRLVDYDGMFLPKFRGERSPELGHKNYQHPAKVGRSTTTRTWTTSPPWSSISAFSPSRPIPGLWDFHDEDNLIFTRNDYADPRHLRALRSAEEAPRIRPVVKLAERLEAVLRPSPGEGPRPGEGPAEHSAQCSGATGDSGFYGRSTNVNAINGSSRHSQFVPADASSTPINSAASCATAGQTATHRAATCCAGPDGPARRSTTHYPPAIVLACTLGPHIEGRRVLDQVAGRRHRRDVRWMDDPYGPVLELGELAAAHHRHRRYPHLLWDEASGIARDWRHHPSSPIHASSRLDRECGVDVAHHLRAGRSNRWGCRPHRDP